MTSPGFWLIVAIAALLWASFVVIVLDAIGSASATRDRLDAEAADNNDWSDLLRAIDTTPAAMNRRYMEHQANERRRVAAETETGA